jgi:NAD(P)-dependent dehydrogenase (short-subunit alcohol dehydrogenase family)
MRALVVGATGTIGSAVADALAAAGHEVLRASRQGQISVDLTDPASIRAMYAEVGRVGAVLSCAGMGRMGSLTTLTDEDWAASVADKLMGNVNLVRLGIDSVEDQGVFVLTGGIWSQKPPPGASAIAALNGALESFARAAAQDLPRGIRIVTVSPPWIDESARKMGQRGMLSAADNAKAYVAAVTDSATPAVVYPR